MKTTVKLTLLFVISLSFLTSCRSYKVMHYNRDEITNLGNVSNCKVYIHAKTTLYKVDKPNLSSAGVKGELTQVENHDTVAEIEDPHTRKQLKKHQYDLNIYTKKEIKNTSNSFMLKKADITDISRITVNLNIGEDIGTAAILGLGVVVWIVIIKSFQGLL